MIPCVHSHTGSNIIATITLILVPRRSLKVVLSWVIRLSITIFQNPEQTSSIWKNPGSSKSSKASFLQALLVYG